MYGGCECHGATFCPDLICIGYDSDVPIYVRKDSPGGQAQLAWEAKRGEADDRATYARLRGLLREALAWIENSKEPAVSLCADIRNVLTS
jgi:hypothetical protein